MPFACIYAQYNDMEMLKTMPARSTPYACATATSAPPKSAYSLQQRERAAVAVFC